MIKFKDVADNEVYARKIDCIVIPKAEISSCRVMMQTTISEISREEAKRLINLLKELEKDELERIG